MFSSVKRKATLAGVKVEDIFSHEAKGFGAAKTTTYIAGPLLLTVEEI